MKREFNIGDVAHLSNNRRLKGVPVSDTENEKAIKTFNLNMRDNLKVIKYRKADIKCGSWNYDVEFEFNGEKYTIEYVGQFDLLPKKMYEDIIMMETRIKELQKGEN